MNTTELQKLLLWIEKNEHTTSSIAAAIGMSYDGVHQVLYVRKRVSPGFRMRFTKAFGEKIADSIFDPIVLSQVTQPCQSTYAHQRKTN